MTILMLRFFLLSTWAGIIISPCPALAQVYSGVNSAGELVLSNFSSGETPTVVVPGQVVAELALTNFAMRQKSTFPIPAAIRALVEDSAKEYGLDPLLLHAVIKAESGYNVQAISSRGARGLMQVMPDTGLRFGVKNLLDPRENIKAGAQYLRWLLARFNGDVELALAGYNAGEQAVIRAGYRVPSYKETRHYVPKVLHYYHGVNSDVRAVNNNENKNKNEKEKTD